VGSFVDAPVDAILVNKFENAINLTTQKSAGATIKKVLDNKGGSPFALEMKGDPDTPLTNDYVSIFGAVPFPHSRFLMARAVFYVTTGNPKIALEIRLGSRADGDDPLAMSIWLMTATDKLQYYDSAGAFQDIATGLSLPNNAGYAALDLIVDTSTEKFVKCFFAGKEYSLANIAPKAEADDFPENCEIFFGIVNPTDAQTGVYLKELVAARWD